MPGVHIVTDSACDLTDGLVKEHDIVVVPLTIRFGSEELEDRRQLTPAEFWERCRGRADLPQTAAPSPGAFGAAFAQAVDEGADAVLCLTISSRVSGTYDSARTAAESFDRVPIQVVDTYSLSMGQGLMAVAAAEEAADGAELDELVTATRDRIGRTRLYGVLGGLEHLQKGGRIGGASAMLGSLLNIKPVIQVKDGEVAEESKQRTRSRALAYLQRQSGCRLPGGAHRRRRRGVRRLPRRARPPGGDRDRAPAPRRRSRTGGRDPCRTQHRRGLLHRSGRVERGTPTGNLTACPRPTSPTRSRSVRSTTIDTVVATVNDKAIRPAVVAARGVVFGVIIGVIGLAVLVLFCVLFIRADHHRRPPGVGVLHRARPHLLGRGCRPLREARPAT